MVVLWRTRYVGSRLMLVESLVLSLARGWDVCRRWAYLTFFVA